MYRYFSVVIIFAVFLLSACSSEVQEKLLDNGMRVIVKVDNRSPVVVSQIWYQIGSMDEPTGKTGVSHVLEHMMFKGTEKLKPGEFSKIIARNGGRENAFTSHNYTAYFQTLEKSRLPIAFELEADRMQNLVFDKIELKREVSVVKEERRLRTEDKPSGKLYEAFRAKAYQVHPYGRPIIGSMKDLNGLTVNDLSAWYKKWYVPNNATLVVVGDVNPAEVFALAKKNFAHIPARTLPARDIESEPRQSTARRITVKIPAQVPRIIIGFHTPVIEHENNNWEPYALDMLAGILDGGESARFSSSLIRDQRIASSAGAGYDSIARAPSMFVIDATPFNGRSVADLERALLQQIEKIKFDPASQEEIDRVRAQVIASDVYQRDSMFYQGMEIGMLTMSDLDWRIGKKYVNRINSVTPEQIISVAKKYLIESNMTVAILQPVKTKKEKTERTLSGGKHGS